MDIWHETISGRVGPVRRKILGLTLIVACAVTASACGGSSGSGTKSGSKLTEVTLQAYGPSVTSLLINYAQSEGLFKKQGLDVVQNPPIFNAAGILTPLIAGKADIALTGALGSMPVWVAGRPIKIVATFSTGFDNVVVLNNAAMAKLAAKGITAASPLETKVRALRGLKLSTDQTGSGTYAGLIYELQKAGLNPTNDVTIQPLPSASAIITAARQGDVDGYDLGLGEGAGEAVTDHFGQIFINFQTEDPDFTQMPANILVATSSYIQQNSGIITRFLYAMKAAKAAFTAGLSTEASERLRSEVLPTMTPALFESQWPAAEKYMGGSLMPTMAQFKVLFQVFNVTAGKPQGLTYTQVVDPSIAQKVMTSAG